MIWCPLAVFQPCPCMQLCQQTVWTGWPQGLAHATSSIFAGSSQKLPLGLTLPLRLRAPLGVPGACPTAAPHPPPQWSIKQALILPRGYIAAPLHPWHWYPCACRHGHFPTWVTGAGLGSVAWGSVLLRGPRAPPSARLAAVPPEGNGAARGWSGRGCAAAAESLLGRVGPCPERLVRAVR